MPGRWWRQGTWHRRAPVEPVTTRRQALETLGETLGLATAWLSAPLPLASARAQSPQSIAYDRASRLTQGGWARGQAPAGAQLTLDGKPVAVDDAGRFFLGFDRDAGPAAAIAMSRDGLGLSYALPITPRHWQIETIAAPFHPPELPDAEFARLRAEELAQIGAARRMASDAQGWRQAMRWPAKGRISGLFGAQRVYRGPDGKSIPAAYHPGVDIAVPAGTPYVAPADGVVILAAGHPFTLEGNLLMVDHGMGLNSAFLHCAKLLVKRGDKVAQGQVLGLTGMTGRATGPHLHWALKWREARLDPLLFAGAMG